MVLWVSNICHLFKDYAIHNLQKDLALHLLIEQQGTEVLHKKMLVPMLFKNLDFIYKFEYVCFFFRLHTCTYINIQDDRGTLVCHTFKADWFMNMIVDVIFLNGLHLHLNMKNIDTVFGLAGATAFNALSYFRKGIYKNIDASTEQFCDLYSRTISIIKLI